MKKLQKPEDYLKYFGKQGRDSMCYDGPFPKTPEEALLISIAKWTILSKDPSFQSDGGADTCGYCMYYKMRESVSTVPACGRCPIYRRTKQINCLDTPYLDWAIQNEPNVNGNEKRKLKAAKKELDFLKSFLTKNKKRVKQSG